MSNLGGRVALVTGAGTGIGRAVALALSARGAHVVVFGPIEKALAETVGEIVYGGGKARHVVGDARDEGHAENAVARALEAFGGLHIVVAAGGDASSAEGIFRLATRHMSGWGRLLVWSATEAEAIARVGATARELAPRKITCNALVAEDDEDEHDGLAQLAAFICSPAADKITGKAIALRGAARGARLG